MTAIDQKQINKQQTNRYEKYYRQIGLNMKTSLSLESLFDIAGVLQVAPRALLDFRDEKPQDFHE